MRVPERPLPDVQWSESRIRRNLATSSTDHERPLSDVQLSESRIRRNLATSSTDHGA
jgi:hypothetical protein